MSDTPETDALRERFLTAGEWPDLFAHARRLERERDEAMEKAKQWEKIALRADTERAEAIKQNAKLRDIAERAIELALAYYDGPCERDGAKLRLELDQLKEGVE